MYPTSIDTKRDKNDFFFDESFERLGLNNIGHDGRICLIG